MCVFLHAPASSASASDAALAEFQWLWPHRAPFDDLSIESVLDGRPAFQTWRAIFEANYRERLNAVPIGAALGVSVMAPTQRRGYTLREMAISFRDTPTLGALLAVPEVIDPRKPLIIAVHGHEMDERGTAPWTLFNDGVWAERWAQAGYVVWAPSHLWYSTFAPLYEQGHDFHIVWTLALSRMLDGARPHFPAHSGLVATGLSAGGASASFLAALRSDIDAGVFAGSLIGLDFLRENYRVRGHPNNWDVYGLLDYAPIYALIAPRRVQWQMGRQDTFFPRTIPVPGSGRFPGLPRPVSVQTFLGEWLLLERIWTNAGGAASLHIHPDGHLYDFEAAREFIEGR